MSRTCIWCGAMLQEGDAFCTNCGNKVQVEEVSEFFETEVDCGMPDPAVEFAFPPEGNEQPAAPSGSPVDIPAPSGSPVNIPAPSGSPVNIPAPSGSPVNISSPSGEAVSFDFSAQPKREVQQEAAPDPAFRFPTEAAGAGPAEQTNPEPAFQFPAEDVASAGSDATSILEEEQVSVAGFVFPAEDEAAVAQIHIEEKEVDIFAGADETSVLTVEEEINIFQGADTTTVLSEETDYSEEEDAATSVLIEKDEYEDEATSVLIETRYYLVREKDNEKLQITLPCVVGRGRDADYKIRGNLAVSRTHVRIMEEDGVYMIEDLSSTNSTYIDEIILPAAGKAEIKPDGKIKLGDESFIFVVEN